MRSFLTAVLLFFGVFCSAQDFSNLWEGYFSYLNIIDISSSEDLLYAASENAIFTYDYLTNDIEKISTVEGLSGGDISSVYYSEVNDILVVGYENGLMDVVLPNDDVLVVIDIINKVTIPPNQKRINSFFELDGILYISTDFGISLYDLSRLEFGDTYFVGNGGTQVQVNQVTVYDGFIYAACGDGNGLKRADFSSPNLIDFSEWITLRGGNFRFVETIGDKIYGILFNRNIVDVLVNPNAFLFEYPTEPRDMRAQGAELLVTTTAAIYIYDEQLNLIDIIDNNPEFGVNFTATVKFGSSEYFIGTEGLVNDGKSGKGVLRTTISNPTEFEEIHPDGPLNNNAFSIETYPNDLWIVFGGYSRTFNPNGGIRRAGISRFLNGEWRNIEYDAIANVIEDPFFLSDIAINPFDTEQVFITSHWSGVIEFNSEQATILYNEDNSSLAGFNNANLNFVSVNKFDRNGALWVMNSRVPSPMNKFENGQWESYDFTSIIPVPPPSSNIGFSSLAFDNRETVFTGSFSFGLVGFNDTIGNEILGFASGEEDNFPSPFVKALTFDNNGQLWIGTEKGLRILFNSANFFDNSQVNNIVILEEGIPKELLANQLVTTIAVDGSNNKWVGTADSGLFYFSPDGQETIFQFTTDNSPLPTNNINEVAIDPSTGKVYIATSKGLLAFTTGSSTPEDTLEEAYVYPNPVRPEYNILGFDDLNDVTKGVKITGLTENVNIKITDIEGNLVAEAQSRVNLRTSRANYNFAIDGGTAIWNGKNLANNVVATGVYLIFISDLDSVETKVLKLLIVR